MNDSQSQSQVLARPLLAELNKRTGNFPGGQMLLDLIAKLLLHILPSAGCFVLRYVLLLVWV